MKLVISTLILSFTFSAFAGYSKEAAPTKKVIQNLLNSGEPISKDSCSKPLKNKSVRNLLNKWLLSFDENNPGYVMTGASVPLAGGEIGRSLYVGKLDIRRTMGTKEDPSNQIPYTALETLRFAESATGSIVPGSVERSCMHN